MVGWQKRLWTAVLNGGEGVPMGGNNSEELLLVGQREGSERSGSHQRLSGEDSEMASLTEEMGWWRWCGQILVDTVMFGH
jgi:hypothetical protein